jgi:hypothetical protein
LENRCANGSFQWKAAGSDGCLVSEIDCHLKFMESFIANCEKVFNVHRFWFEFMTEEVHSLDSLRFKIQKIDEC